MRTWSVANVIDRATIGFVRAASLGAVVVQGVLDAVLQPHFQPVGDSHPIPGCPDAVECRTHGCAGDCSEALDYEAEEECGVLNDGLTPFDPQWKMTIADGSRRCGIHTGRASNRCLLLRGHHGPHDDDPETSLAVSADVRDSAAESGSPPSPSAACTDPSPTGDEGPAGDSAIPTTPPAGRPDSFSDGVLAAANIIGDAAQKQWRELLDSPVLHPKAHLLDVARLLDGLTQQLRDHANEYAPK